MSLGSTVILAAVATLTRWAVQRRWRHTGALFGAGILAWGAFHWLLVPFVAGTYRVDSGSMRATLLPGDVVLVNKLSARVQVPGRGDVVIFCAQDGEASEVVKRIVGVPGDVVELRQGDLYVNGALMPEPYVTHRSAESFKLVQEDGRYVPVTWHGEELNSPRLVAERYVAPTAERREFLRRTAPAPVPAGTLLVFGDQRPGSSDSRRWGLVPLADLVGKAQAVVLPLSRQARL